MLADALKDAARQELAQQRNPDQQKTPLDKPAFITVTDLMEGDTWDQLAAGGDISETVMGRMLRDAVHELGGETGAFVWDPKKWVAKVDITYPTIRSGARTPEYAAKIAKTQKPDSDSDADNYDIP